MVETLFIAVFGSILSMMAPGPNFVAVASTALGSGRRAAIWVTMGVAAGTMLWVLVAAFSFGMLLAAQPALMALLKILGGAYLCWIAVRIILGLVSKNKSHFKQRRVRQSWMRHFWFGFVVVATNPKALMLWASLSTFLFDAGFAAWTVALFGPCAFVLSFLNYAGTHIKHEKMAIHKDSSSRLRSFSR